MSENDHFKVAQKTIWETTFAYLMKNATISAMWL